VETLDQIKKLSYNRLAVNIVRTFHIGNLLKYLYFQLCAPKNRRVELNFRGIKAVMAVNDFEDLRVAGTMFDKGDREEGKMLSPLIEILRKGDIAYDIGANIGIHSIFMAKRVGEEGRIIAIEPEMLNYGALIKNIGLNNLSNVTAIKVALGDKIETGHLYLRRRIGRGAVSLIKSEDSNLCQDVEIMPGDILVQDMKLSPPKAVKIDVEGYEYSVIKGLRKTLSQNICRIVCCEIHPNLLPGEITPKEILNLLKSIGFNKIESYSRGNEIHAVCCKD